MKRFALLITAALLGISSTMAQSLNKSEAKNLGAFLQQTSPEGKSNAAALGIVGNNITAAHGVKIENGRIVEIDWGGKKLAGTLNLSGFPALTKINVSHNKISALTIANNPALVEVDAGHNAINSFAVSACPQLQVLRLDRNMLSDLNVGAVPFLKKLDISSNYFEALDVTNAFNLETLNVFRNLRSAAARASRTSTPSSTNFQASCSKVS